MGFLNQWGFFGDMLFEWVPTNDLDLIFIESWFRDYLHKILKDCSFLLCSMC